jgi:hypothetical protein
MFLGNYPWKLLLPEHAKCKRQASVRDCTKSARWRFWTQDVCYLERHLTTRPHETFNKNRFALPLANGANVCHIPPHGKMVKIMESLHIDYVELRKDEKFLARDLPCFFATCTSMASVTPSIEDSRPVIAIALTMPWDNMMLTCCCLVLQWCY